MKQGKSYLIQVPDGRQFVAEYLGSEKDHYVLKFEPSYSKSKKKINRMRFESGVACMEGTDHLILKEMK
jgi:hypothetical protein